jgi:glycerol uptake facilitator-like aquaporin
VHLRGGAGQPDVANPAITVGRMFSDTFAGIAPSSAPSFIAAQLLGGAVAFALIRILYPKPAEEPTDQNEPMAAQTTQEVV